MDINKLLEGVNCKCGRTHSCNIKQVFIERNATLKLTEICKEYNNILIVADENTFSASGEKVLLSLKDKSIKKVIFTGKEILVPDEKAIKTVENELSEVELIIGIGSGVVQDLCKYVAFYKKLQYIIVATAPSMDGYASDGAAMITDGMKVTYPAGLPLAIIADTLVIKNAPLDMLKAGFGDIIGKYSALNDWKLSHLINDEYFCEYIYSLTYEQIEKTLSLADGILKRDEESVKALMEALVIIGILMSFAGSSRPASGSEHHLSHFFEITGIIDKTSYLPHGIDVAYSTVITEKLRERLIKEPFPKKIFRESHEHYSQKLNAIYKGVAEGCINLQKKVGNYEKNRLSCYLENEAEIKSILSEVPSSDKLEKMLSLVELDINEFYNFYDKDKINNAVLYAKELKDRYTCLWLNYDFYGGENNE